ncbi:MAG: hypothetical protein ACKOU6_13810 [Planctomycetota bacterium]
MAGIADFCIPNRGGSMSIRFLATALLVATFMFWNIYQVGQLRIEFRDAKKQVAQALGECRQAEEALKREHQFYLQNSSLAQEDRRVLRLEWQGFEQDYSPDIRHALHDNLASATQVKCALESEYQNADNFLSKSKTLVQSLEELHLESTRQAASIRELNDMEKLEKRIADLGTTLDMIEKEANRRIAAAEKCAQQAEKVGQEAVAKLNRTEVELRTAKNQVSDLERKIQRVRYRVPPEFRHYLY